MEDIAAAVEALRKTPEQRVAGAPVPSSQRMQTNTVSAATSPTDDAALLDDES